MGAAVAPWIITATLQTSPPSVMVKRSAPEKAAEANSAAAASAQPQKTQKLSEEQERRRWRRS